MIQGRALKRWSEDRVFVIATASLVVLVAVAWISYGLFGRRVIETVYLGKSFSVLGGALAGRSETPVANYYREAERLLWVLTSVPLLFLAGAALAKAQLLDRLLLSAASFLFALFVVFCTIEVFPGLIAPLGLDRKLEYYAHKKMLRPHETLIYVPQDDTQRFGKVRFQGDSYSRAYGVQTETVEFGYWPRNNGFVIGPQTDSADVVILGDSYVEAGSNYEDILGSRLAAESGLATVTLGVGGYGPFQYLDMFKTYGAQLKPRYAVLAFFEGNDALNVKDYLGWRKGDGGYYDRIDHAWSPPLWRRYFYVLGESAESLKKAGENLLAIAARRTGFGADGVHPDLAVLNLGGRKRFAVMRYKNDTRSPEEMRESAEWKAFGDLLEEFREIAEARGIVPIVLYIPGAAHIYGEFTTEESGTNWLEIRNEQIRAAGNEEKALAKLARERRVEVVSLTPVFKAAAQSGRMLYYPFDSHWNSAGRQIAAAHLARILRPDGAAGPHAPPARRAWREERSPL